MEISYGCTMKHLSVVRLSGDARATDKKQVLLPPLLLQDIMVEVY